MPRLLIPFAGGLLAAIVLGGCAQHPAAPAGSSSIAATVQSCDETLTMDKPASTVVMMSDTDAAVMAELHVLDRVVGRAGTLKTEAYAPEVAAKLTAIPEVQSTKLDTGGAKVSTETILATGADVVIGYDTGVDRAALAKAGIKLYSPDTFCPRGSVQKASFQQVHTEVDKVAALFGVPGEGKRVNDQLERDIAALPAPAAPRGSVAVLYVTPGSKQFYAYGSSSMSQPIVEANGLRNAYEDQTKRVFDASMEDLLQRDPDNIVLLYGAGQEDAVRTTFAGFQGADRLKAVASGHVVTLPFALTDPPTPNSVRGATELAARLPK